ncbi:LysR family transcriptional regulator, partial [Salmonella enterica subsp. enterica serovar Kentucky]|nr:LysR family transcriptional regulator [Salmonella enterica subsp. enterica serovar Kentucky]
MQLNMLEAMNIYVNVVEQGSFIRAAEVLELHRPAVTRAVQNLEHDLGVKLLHRTTRQVSMTDEGEEFYQRCLSLLSELDDVRRLFSSTQPPKGRLRLDVPITLARAVIIPALGDFQNRYPDIEIVLGTSDRKIDLIAERVDCVIRLGELNDSSFVARRLGTAAMVTCAAPSYLAKHGTPHSIDELMKSHRAVNFFSNHSLQIMEWKFTVDGSLALIPVISMLLLLIIGYGIMGLRIEPLLLCSAAVAAGIAWWQGYCWEDIINSVVDKLAKAMPVIMILICVGGLIGTWMFSGTIPYMVYWGLKLISPEYILIAAFFLTSVVSVCTGTSWGSAGTVGVALMGVAAGLDVSLAAAAGAVVSGAYFGDKISPLSDSTNFAAIVADTTLFEHIQHLLWTTLPSFLLAAVVYLIAGHSNMLGEVATPQRVTDIIHSLESLYHFNIVLILPPVIVLWGAIRKKPVIPLMLSACVLALFLGVIMQGLSIKQGLDAFIDGFDIAMFPQGAEGVVA